MKKKALIFDCDGVIADTERYGHLRAFNQMWSEEGVKWRWSLEQYAEKLKIGGGKERMFSLRDDPEFQKVYDVPSSEDEWWEVVAGWHRRKGEIYRQLVQSGAIPGRTGVKRLAESTLADGWLVAVCSTSAVSSVEAITRYVMGPATAGRLAGIFAGDMAKAKKPAPDVYFLAADRLDLDPADCIVIEDSRNGLLAAVTAGMTCLVTYNDLTKDEDFSEAAIVVSELGDPGVESIIVTRNRTSVDVSGFLTVRNLEEILAGQHR
ncbi:MAG: HAD family hydrolase [Spirochaetaceae bacterium]|nr:MAG: HAD family hydrolase [Spirochaetaceae bacterium]